MRSRRRLILLLAAAMTAAASPAADPRATVSALYREIPRPVTPELLSRKLRGLFHLDAGRRDHNLSFEWRSGGQNQPEITGLHLHLINARRETAQVEATFYNRGERRFRRFFLIMTAGRWVIDDVLMVPENGRLSDFLKSKG